MAEAWDENNPQYAISMAELRALFLIYDGHNRNILDLTRTLSRVVASLKRCSGKSLRVKCIGLLSNFESAITVIARSSHTAWE